MAVSLETAVRLVQLAQVRNRKRREVIEWTEREARSLRLVTNREAPMWDQYNVAEEQLAQLLTYLGEGE